MQMIFIDIDNTLLDFDAYIRQTMREGFAHFGLKPYEPYMEAVFPPGERKTLAADRAGHADVRGTGGDTLGQRVFAALDIAFDGQVFEKYFRAALYDSAIPVDGAMELLEGAPRQIPPGGGQQRPLRTAAPPAGAGGHEAVFRLVLRVGETGCVQAGRAFLTGRLRH